MVPDLTMPQMRECFAACSLVTVESQYPIANTASVIQLFLSRQLGPDSILQPVSERIIKYWTQYSDGFGSSNYTKRKAALLVAGVCALFGGLEALFILTLRVCNHSS